MSDVILFFILKNIVVVVGEMEVERDTGCRERHVCRERDMYAGREKDTCLEDTRYVGERDGYLGNETGM